MPDAATTTSSTITAATAAVTPQTASRHSHRPPRAPGTPHAPPSCGTTEDLGVRWARGTISPELRRMRSAPSHEGLQRLQGLLGSAPAEAAEAAEVVGAAVAAGAARAEVRVSSTTAEVAGRAEESTPSAMAQRERRWSGQERSDTSEVSSGVRSELNRVRRPAHAAALAHDLAAARIAGTDIGSVGSGGSGGCFDSGGSDGGNGADLQLVLAGVGAGSVTMEWHALRGGGGGADGGGGGGADGGGGGADGGGGGAMPKPPYKMYELQWQAEIV